MNINLIYTAQSFGAKQPKVTVSQKPPVSGVYYGQDALDEALLQDCTHNQSLIIRRIPSIIKRVEENYPDMPAEKRDDLIQDLLLRDMEYIARHDLDETTVQFPSSALSRIEHTGIEQLTKKAEKAEKGSTESYLIDEQTVGSESIEDDYAQVKGLETAKETIDDVLDTLSPKEKMVIKKRFGLDDGRQYTLEEVGDEFGCNRERIRQIEAKALRKLRHPSRSRILKDIVQESSDGKLYSL